MTAEKMDIEIEGRHKNTLLHREEFNFEILGVKKTPTRTDIRNKLSGKLGANEELVVVDEIIHEFGSTRVVGFAKRYDSIEDLKRVEPAYMRKKHGEKMDAKTATEAASTPEKK